MHLPARQIGIGAMSLVIQDGPERMELDRCLHHPPARDRLGVAPAQPRNLIRLPNCALLGSSAAPLRAAARKDSAPARKTGEEQDRDRLAYPVMEGKTIMNLGTGFSRRHPRSVILIRVLVAAWLLGLTGILLAYGYWGWALLTLAGAVANIVWAYRVFRATMR
jgi:hypothetical protein